MAAGAIRLANYVKRFLMLKTADEVQDARQIVVVRNWFEALRRRMAGGMK